MPAFMKIGDIKGEATDADQRIDDPAIAPTPNGDEALRLNSTIVAPADGDTEARAGHKGEIYVESFTWGVSQVGSADGPDYFDGRLLTAGDATREQAVPLEDVVISSYSISGHGAGDPGEAILIG